MMTTIRNGKNGEAGLSVRLRGHIPGREQHVLAIFLLVVGSTAGIVLYSFDSHAFLYFGDAVSHIVRARQFFDSQRPGFHNLGTVWLPLPHLILLPFVAIDALFYSGIAGPLVGIPCLAGTGVLLFQIVRRVTGSPFIAFLSGCLFGLNPNIVYMALTPMNEALLIFLVALGGYALLRWLSKDGEIWAWVCAVAVALASLCRYESWMLVFFASVVMVAAGMFRWHRHERTAAVGVVAAAGLCWAGVAFWGGWNYFEYGDPLTFARWTYAVAPGPEEGMMRLSPREAFLIFGKALLVIFGPLVLLMSSAVFFRPRYAQPNRTRSGLVLSFLGLPAIFALAAILAGFVRVDQWRWNWRYVLTASLFLSVVGGIGLDEFYRRVQSAIARGLFVACLLAMPLVQVALPSVGVATFDDARRSVSDKTRFSMDIGEKLHALYRSGSIALLTGYGQAQRIMISSGLPLRQFHIIYSSGEEDILGSPADGEQYLVIAKDPTPESEEFVNDWLSRKDELLAYYVIRFENSHHILMERKSGSISR